MTELPENTTIVHEKTPPKILFHVICLWADEELLSDGELHGQLLSDDDAIFRKVLKGTRRGKRAELRLINAEAMHHDGFVFSHSENDGSWRTYSVPHRYILGCKRLRGKRDLISALCCYRKEV